MLTSEEKKERERLRSREKYRRLKADPKRSAAELEKRRQWYAAHREQERRRRREKYLSNIDSEKASQKKYHFEHADEISERNKLKYQRDKEKVAEYHRRYYQEHREHFLAINRKWRQEHPEAARLYCLRSTRKIRETSRQAEDDRRKELAFFRGLAVASSINAISAERLESQIAEISRKRKAALAEQARYKLEWQRQNRDRMRLYKQRWLEKLKADPERYQAYLDKEHARRRQSRTKHNN